MVTDGQLYQHPTRLSDQPPSHTCSEVIGLVDATDGLTNAPSTTLGNFSRTARAAQSTLEVSRVRVAISRWGALSPSLTRRCFTVRPVLRNVSMTSGTGGR